MNRHNGKGSEVGTVVQLVRAPPCHGGSCGFEPRQSRKFSLSFQIPDFFKKSGISAFALITWTLNTTGCQNEEKHLPLVTSSEIPLPHPKSNMASAKEVLKRYNEDGESGTR